ncbi:MAG: DUF1415 domain-containing protein [Aureispira sp.]|nr:DUF1415 domain-containing protein [Aureispira sp.]
MPDHIQETKNWIVNVIVGYNFCPFAKREVLRDSIHYQVEETTDLMVALQTLLVECQRLDEEESMETAFVLYPNTFKTFKRYLKFLDLAEALLIHQEYEGTYQLASFHPEYCFADAEADDPANYTNRSPYPMLHIIREESLEAALKSYKEPESIPERNIRVAREMGLAKMQDLLKDCYKH